METITRIIADKDSEKTPKTRCQTWHFHGSHWNLLCTKIEPF